MIRRSFLRVLGLGAAAAAATPLLEQLDPERLLWVPGAKTFFLPPVEPVALFHGPHPLKGHRARQRGGNSLLTIQMVTQEALRVLENSLAFSKVINRQYDDKFFTTFEGAHVGMTVNARKPLRLSELQDPDRWSVTEGLRILTPRTA